MPRHSLSPGRRLGALITVRRLRDPREFMEAVEVQRRAWRMDDYREAAPAHLLKGLSDNGGLVLGAFEGDRLVGVSYGWPASHYFYSHATGVVEEAKYRGVGFKLKTAQRSEVLSLYGFSLAKWTFDPLQSLNSRFNLARLGVVSKQYMVNYYGEIDDSINRGLGSDRVKAEWWLTSPRVIHRLSAKQRPCLSAMKQYNPIAAYGVESSNGVPLPGKRTREDDLMKSEIVLVPIPRSIGDVRDASMAAAVKWREATRWAYSLLVENGFILVDNVEGGINYTLNVFWRVPLGKVLSGPEPWRDCGGEEK
ncbi:MAG: hypothetical protein GSR73_01795 [Desulfurococcales archaeon]|nr:hypothetical protein [Desulfurococcales archaeon]